MTTHQMTLLMQIPVSVKTIKKEMLATVVTVRVIEVGIGLERSSV